MPSGDEYMPNDVEIANDFLRSSQWIALRDSGRLTRKKALRNCIRDYLTATYKWMGKSEEHTEREKYVGRVEFLIRSRWGKKAARTRAQNKKRKARELARRAKIAIERFEKLKRPLLFGEGLPVQKKPPRRVA